MKLDELSNPVSYLTTKILAGISNKFKAGDYVRVSHVDWRTDELKLVDNQESLYYFNSDVSDRNDFQVLYKPIYKINIAEAGYIEAKLVNLFDTLPEFKKYSEDAFDEEDFQYSHALTGDLYDDITEFVDNNGRALENMDPEEIVKQFVDTMIILDQDYADSVILDVEYIPYQSEVSALREAFDKVEELKAEDAKELRRRAALRGHDTRRKKKEYAARKVEMQKALEKAKELDAFMRMFQPPKKKTVKKSKVLKKTTKKQALKKKKARSKK